MSSLTMTSNATKSLLKQMIDKIEPIDFRSLVDNGSNGDVRLTNKHYLVGTVDNVLSIAKENNWGLCRSNGFIYVFNGEYWNNVDELLFQGFLAQAAYKMGVSRIDAKHYIFQEQLLRQFYSSASLSNLNKDKGIILINLQNGTYEITAEGGRLRKFSHKDFLTYQLPFCFEPTATAPLFMKYLERVLPDPALQMILSEFLGYVFIRSLKLEKCLLLYGSGANGKSVFFEIVNALLGKANISNYSLTNLSEEHNRALIVDKLLNYGSEIRGNIQSDIFKQLVSGEPIQCRLKYGNSFTIEDYARLCFNCNELPKEVEHTEAFFRRFIIIPFNTTIPEHERDPELAKRIIQEELPGVFNWVLDGVNRLNVQKSFTYSEVVRGMVEDYRQQSDSVHLFLSGDEYVKSNDTFTLLKHIYPDYRVFCQADGYKALSKTNFKKRLENLGYTVERKNIGLSVFLTKAKR
ncbi:DNA primase family protein [Terrimonas alba]|uniref:DNA primase family protein n=1 Tax=Terrimonas alba TaxID=3349636 RepID=UPI0035F31DD7